MNDCRNLTDEVDEKIYEDILDMDGKNLIKYIYSKSMKRNLRKSGLNSSDLYDQKVMNVND
jgi:hypothetical protein